MRHFDHAVLQFGVEEPGFGTNAFSLSGEKTVFSFLVGWEIGDVVEHPAEFLVDLLWRKLGCRHWFVVFYQSETPRKLAGAQAGLVKTLAGAGTAVEHVEVLALTILGGQLGAAFLESEVQNLEVRLNDVGNIAKQGRGALLAILEFAL